MIALADVRRVLMIFCVPVSASDNSSFLFIIIVREVSSMISTMSFNLWRAGQGMSSTSFLRKDGEPSETSVGTIGRIAASSKTVELFVTITIQNNDFHEECSYSPKVLDSDSIWVVFGCKRVERVPKSALPDKFQCCAGRPFYDINLFRTLGEDRTQRCFQLTTKNARYSV